MTAPLTSERPLHSEGTEQVVQRAGGWPTLPTWAVLASLASALVAALAFFITGTPDATVREPSARTAAGGSVAPDVSPRSDAPRQGDGRRGAPGRTASVDVYNNSGRSGVAATTSSEVRALGWTVATEDNWYGSIPKNTVYYPAALADDAELLAKDLGIARTRPAVSPMSFERLTVILTR